VLVESRLTKPNAIHDSVAESQLGHYTAGTESEGG
jgi:hypothetical protein